MIFQVIAVSGETIEFMMNPNTTPVNIIWGG